MFTIPLALRTRCVRANIFSRILFGQTVNTARWLLLAILLPGIGLSAFWLKADRPVAGAAKASSVEPSRPSQVIFNEIRKLTAGDAAMGTNFGVSSAISGDIIVVGTPGKDSATGAVYIYDRNQGGANNWGQIKKLTASDAAVSDRFGYSVGINGDTIVAGAYTKNSSAGAAYVFQRNQGRPGNWGEVKKLTASDAASNDQFGASSGISGDTILIAANRKNLRTGAAYIFERN